MHLMFIYIPLGDPLYFSLSPSIVVCLFTYHIVFCFLCRFTFYTQQRCGFRKAARKVEPKKGSVEEVGQPHAELAEKELSQRRTQPLPTPPTPHMPPRAFGRLVKPLVFTIGVGYPPQYTGLKATGHLLKSGVKVLVAFKPKLLCECVQYL